MASKTASSEYSAGARYERAALRTYLERMIAQGCPATQDVYRKVLGWVRRRESRYAKRPGGL